MWKERNVPEQTVARFEQVVLPHLDAAYNLARWLTRDDHDAEDLVQVAYLLALQFFGGFHGEDSRAGLLTIVRNACFTWLEPKLVHGPALALDEQCHCFETLQSAIKNSSLRFPTPPGLAPRVQAAVRKAGRADRTPRLPIGRLLAVAASLALIATAGWGLARVLSTRPDDASLTRELVASHV